MSYTVRLESTPDTPKTGVIDLVNGMDNYHFPGCENIRLKESFIWVARDLRGNEVGYGTLRYLPLDRCGYLSRAAVVKEHRRHGLHKRLLRARLNYSKQQDWKGVLTYVWPWNIASVNSLFKAGFSVYSPEYRWAGKEFLYFQRTFEN